MSRVKAFDAFFLATETRRSPWHMAGCEIFELPAKSGAAFLDKLEAGLREQAAVAPFNQKLEMAGGWPRWREVEVDLDYHLQRQVLPGPGADAQLMSAMEHFCASTLDRSLPLWECCLYEGLSGNRFAIAFKVHHALMDGQGGLKMLLRSLTTRKADKQCRALWGDNTGGETRTRGKRKKASAMSLPLLPDPVAMFKDMTEGKWLRRFQDLRLFRARRSLLNHEPASSARRFGIGDLPLAQVREVTGATGTTVNDVLLSVVDAGLARYLAESGSPAAAPLIVGMPVSTRKEGSEGGNQAGLLAIELGDPDATELQRLKSIQKNTERAKEHLRDLPAGFIMAYGVAILGMPLLLQRLGGLAEKLPLMNLGVSNVSPPRGSDYLDKNLYLQGARLVGLYTQPILPPAVLLNVTAASMKGKLCLGIGSTREAIAEPLVLAQYIQESLRELAEQVARDN